MIVEMKTLKIIVDFYRLQCIMKLKQLRKRFHAIAKNIRSLGEVT